MSLAIIEQIARDIAVQPHQVQAAVELLDGGATVPFIARYRKETTGGLDDIQLRELEARLSYLRELAARREAVLKSIEEQGKLTPALRAAIGAAPTKQELEDLYLPYKPKRRTKGQIAREFGIEPLADQLWADPTLDPQEAAKPFVKAEKGEGGEDFTTIPAVLDGVRDILSERWAEDAALVQSLREWLWAEGLLQSKLAAGKNENDPEVAKFRDYHDYDEPIGRVPSHRALAVFRGRALEILDAKLVVPEAVSPSPQPSPQRGEGASPARVPGSVDFLPLPLAGEGRGEGAPPITHIAIVATPRISNLDEFQPLKNVPGVTLSWARTPAALHGADTLILPGSKATAADLAWLRAQGLDAAIAAHAAAGGRVLGICGGLQMLGEALIDVHGVESQGNAPGLGLLPLVTSFEPQKTVRRTTTRFGELAGAWGALSGVPVSGYEIHSGQTAQHPAMAAKGDVAREVIPGLAWQNAAGNVMGCYLHGLFEDAAVLRALFGARAPSLDDVFDRLVDTLAQACAPGVLDALIAP